MIIKNQKPILLYNLLLLLTVLLFLFSSSCKDKTAEELKGISLPEHTENVPSENKLDPSQTSDYMSMADWQRAKHEVIVVETILQIEINAFFSAYSRVIEARRYDQFDAALDHAKDIEPSLLSIENSIAKINRVDNYPEIDELKQNLILMVPLLRSFSELLVKSVVLAKKGDLTSENVLVEKYCSDYQKAMAYLTKVYEIYGIVLTRAARTESQNLTGPKRGGPTITLDFLTKEKNIAIRFNKITQEQLPLIESLAATKKYSQCDQEALSTYTAIQNLIMELNTLEPGNEKILWDAKGLLASAMSYRMFEISKYREYLSQINTDSKEIEQTKKLYLLMKSLADQEWQKYKNTRR